jgi:RNA polymerase sigma-32 factor
MAKSKTKIPTQSVKKKKVSTTKALLPVPAKSDLPAKQDPLQRYMMEVGRYPILSAEEEAIVARHYKEHQDKGSAQKLVLSNLRLVVKIAMEYRSAFQNVLDLIQEGNVGLMRAVEKYDVEKNVRFSSYAAWWVRAYILKFVLDNFRLVKIGTTQAQKKLFFNLMREKENMEKLGFKPTPKLLSEKLNVKEAEVNEMEVRMGSREMELDAPKAHFDGASNMDFLSGSDGSVEDKIEQNELQNMLLQHLEEFTVTLKDKEKQIFSERLFAEVPKTLQEIADEYKISRERIRQIENRVVVKMRDFFKAKGMSVDIGSPDPDTKQG